MKDLVMALKRARNHLCDCCSTSAAIQARDAIIDATMEVQRMLGVPVDGIVGRNTLAAAEASDNSSRAQKIAANIHEEFGLHGCRFLALRLDQNSAEGRRLIEALRVASGVSDLSWPREGA